MTYLTSLWLPILLSAVAVFLVSSIIHMAMQWWHKTDNYPVPNESKVMDALRPFAIPPGDYMMPCPTSMAEMKSPEYREKVKRGPVMIFTVLSGDMGMARPLILWFVYCLVIGIFAGYIAGRAKPPGTPYLEVFRFAGATAFLGYSAAVWQFSIWYRRNWVTSLKSTIDGLIYALVTAGVFGWLWPKA